MALNSKEAVQEFLSDNEKVLLGVFYKNVELREAVKKVLLFGLYNNGTLKKGKSADPLRNAAFNLVAHRGDYSNEQIGSDLRALWEGVNALESAFALISGFVPEPPPAKPTGNRAR
jgi:hypothetical protein